MTAALPLAYRWDGEHMTPIGRFAKEADASFVIGEVYRMAEVQSRSQASHAHEFAWIHQAWLNLPADIADQYPTENHLRKRALIQGGFYHEMIVDAGSNAAAIRVARGFRQHDDFCMAMISGSYVAVRTAKSQSRKAMGNEEFQASKSAIIEIISALIGVSAVELQHARAT